MAKPMSAIGTPTRNTVSIERANASTTGARTACGRLRMTAGLPLSVSGETPAGSCPPGSRSARLDASWFVSTAPRSATPNEPPIERRNVAAPVAVPRSLRSTAFCTARTSTCITMPRPSPSTTM